MAARKTQTFMVTEKLLEENRTSQMTGIGPRDSDTELYIQYLQRFLGVNLSTAQMKLIRTVNYESISRARRKLQEKGLYWGSPEVMKRRRIKGAEIQQVAPKETAQGIQRRIEENHA